METVATEPQLKVDQLGKAALFADAVVRTAMDVVHSDHQAFISHGIQTVELGSITSPRIPTLWLWLIQTIGAGPIYTLFPVSPLQKVIALEIVATASPRSAAFDTEAPLVSERVEKE